MPPNDIWHGVDYAQHSTLQQAMADEVLSRLPRGNALGVDASADMVAYAQQQFGAGPSLRFEVADARRLDFGPRFDKVVSFNALHWVPQQADALRGIRAALRPQGQAHLRLVTRAKLSSLEELAEAVRKEPASAPGPMRCRRRGSAISSRR